MVRYQLPVDVFPRDASSSDLVSLGISSFVPSEYTGDGRGSIFSDPTQPDPASDGPNPSQPTEQVKRQS